MKSLLILAMASLLAVSFGVNHANAMCAIDTDWPSKPCIDTSPPLPLSKSEWRDLWVNYYNLKGQVWMEQQKLELDKQIKSGDLQEWIESGYDTMNFQNYNVWFYYYVNDQAHAPPGYELDESTFHNETPVPLKQSKAGILNKDIQCRDNLELVFKSSNSTPACVKHETITKLIQRGWAKSLNSDSVEPIIKTGTFSGMCTGYCSKEFTITSEKIIYSQNGREYVSEEWVDLPEKIKVISFSEEKWNELIDLVDFQKLNLQPDRIGCPGCADAPIEWIEISYGDQTKRIEFENGDKIPEINPLVIAIWEIRTETEFSIDNFEDCVDAGNPVMESYPRQCRTNDGTNFVEEIDSKIMSPEVQCTRNGGNWLQEFSECELVSQDQCLIMNGTFKECESACRHIPDAQYCTTQCVSICTIP